MLVMSNASVLGFRGKSGGGYIGYIGERAREHTHFEIVCVPQRVEGAGTRVWVLVEAGLD